MKGRRRIFDVLHIMEWKVYKLQTTNYKRQWLLNFEKSANLFQNTYHRGRNEVLILFFDVGHSENIEKNHFFVEIIVKFKFSPTLYIINLFAVKKKFGKIQKNKWFNLGEKLTKIQNNSKHFFFTQNDILIVQYTGTFLVVGPRLLSELTDYWKGEN